MTASEIKAIKGRDLDVLVAEALGWVYKPSKTSAYVWHSNYSTQATVVNEWHHDVGLAMSLIDGLPKDTEINFRYHGWPSYKKDGENWVIDNPAITVSLITVSAMPDSDQDVIVPDPTMFFESRITHYSEGVDRHGLASAICRCFVISKSITTQIAKEDAA